MFIGHSEIVAYLFYGFDADKPTATTALDTRTLSSDFVILPAPIVLSLYQVSAQQVPFGKRTAGFLAKNARNGAPKST
jgi:hypothetical protein